MKQCEVISWHIWVTLCFVLCIYASSYQQCQGQLYQNIMYHTNVIIISRTFWIIIPHSANVWRQKTLVNHRWLIKFYHPNFNVLWHKESKQAGIHQSFTCQKLLIRNLPKFSSTKHSHYMVAHMIDTVHETSCLLEVKHCNTLTKCFL